MTTISGFPAKKQGFTLIELMVAIVIIGLVLTAAVVAFSIVRENSRDSKRVANISTITKSLAMYLNDSSDGFPPSAGECLQTAGGAGFLMKNKGAIAAVPVDPRWPTDGLAANTQYAGAGSSNFCYWYWSDKDTYYLSYYLEGDSKSGSQGSHVIYESK